MINIFRKLWSEKEIHETYMQLEIVSIEYDVITPF